MTHGKSVVVPDLAVAVERLTTLGDAFELWGAHGGNLISEDQALPMSRHIKLVLDTLEAALPPRHEAPARDELPEDDELPGDFLARVGMDGALWAAEFRKMALKLGYSDMDEGWLIGWFCNAVMAGYDHAERKFDPALTPRHEAPAEPCFECESTERTGTACKPCNPEITDPNFGHEAPADPCASHRSIGFHIDPCCPHCEAPAETITSAELIANTDYARGAVRVPGETEDRRIYGQPEAPAEGAGEAPRAAINSLTRSVENFDNGYEWGCDPVAVRAILRHLRARSSAPEAREEALGNLLAVIHGDGGHRALEVGVEQAAAEAEKIVAGLFAAPSADKLRIDLWWNADDWETTFDNIEDAYEAATGGYCVGVARLGRATEHDAVWAAMIDIDTTGDGEADDREIRLFATEDEARQALAALKAGGA